MGGVQAALEGTHGRGPELMLKLIGYADRMSAAPGETVRFMVSALERQPYRAEIVRLIHGDANPDGPGFKAQKVEGAVDLALDGRRHAIAIGSWADIPFHPVMDEPAGGITLLAMIWPTTPARGPAGSDRPLGRDPAGRLPARDRRPWLPRGARRRRRQGKSPAKQRQAAAAARAGIWSAASYDAAAGTMTLVQRPLQAFAGIDESGIVTGPAPIPDCTGLPVTMAALSGDAATTGHFNGKIDSPRLIAGPIAAERLEALLQSPPPRRSGPAHRRRLGLLARDPDDTHRRRSGPTASTAGLVNLPARAMKGWSWDGSEHCWWRKPEHYGAIHFHDERSLRCRLARRFRLDDPGGSAVRLLRRACLVGRCRGRHRRGLYPVLRPAAARARRGSRPAGLPGADGRLSGLCQRPQACSTATVPSWSSAAC